MPQPNGQFVDEWKWRSGNVSVLICGSEYPEYLSHARFTYLIQLTVRTKLPSRIKWNILVEMWCFEKSSFVDDSK